jgi:hypothetical protein
MLDVRTQELAPGIRNLWIVFLAQVGTLFRKRIIFNQVGVLIGVVAVDQTDIVVKTLFVE